MSLTPRQVRMLHVARYKTATSEEDYRALLGRYGTPERPLTSSLDARLQPAHYHEMMKVFGSLGFTPAPRPATPAGGSPAQVREVERLCREHRVEEKRLRGIVLHVTGKDDLRWCGRRDLSKLIQALRRWQWEEEGNHAAR